MHLYDVDGDFTSDVLEIFANDYSNPNWRIHPWIYVFDGGNGVFETSEVLVDEKRDGLNGNEKWISDEIKEKLRTNPYLNLIFKG